MGGIFVRRLLGAVPVLLIVSLMTFGMIHLIPGDPAVAIAGMSPRRNRLPISVATWAGSAAAGAALGLVCPFAAWRSWQVAFARSAGRAGYDAALPVTLALSAYALLLTLLIGLASGIVAALRQNTWVDQLPWCWRCWGFRCQAFIWDC